MPPLTPNRPSCLGSLGRSEAFSRRRGGWNAGASLDLGRCRGWCLHSLGGAKGGEGATCRWDVGFSGADVRRQTGAGGLRFVVDCIDPGTRPPQLIVHCNGCNVSPAM